MSSHLEGRETRRLSDHNVVPPHSHLPYQTFAPINTASQPTSVHKGTSINSAYQPSIQASTGVGSGLQEAVNPSTQTSLPGKVAIPHLRTSNPTETARTSKKGRTSHACDPCRKAKAGCSGGHPCSRCRTILSVCVYGDGKRDREKKELSKLAKTTQYLQQQNSSVIESLQRIRDDSTLSINDLKAAIDELLLENPYPISLEFEIVSPATASRPQLSDADDNEEHGEQEVDADVGSTDSLDVVNIDTDRQDTRGRGHLGKSSAVTWQHRIEELASEETKSANSKRLTPTSIASYHTEDADMEFFDTSNVNLYAWPSPQIAGNLVQSYFDQVHNIYPILNKAEFLFKFQSFPTVSTSLSFEDLIWLASLNFVFAIAAIHGQLTSNPELGDANDHQIYSARASMICSQHEIYLRDARVSSTCVSGLLSLYFLSTTRVNRSWTMCGLAIRHALALGLHVRSIADNVSDVDKEHRVRVWWSLYTLECTLSKLTGRPSCITDRDIGTPFPINMEEADLRAGQNLYDTMGGMQSSSTRTMRSRRSSKDSRALRPPTSYQSSKALTKLKDNPFSNPLYLTSSTFFIYRIQLCIMAHEIITELYSAATVKGKWVDAENEIERIEKKFQTWSAKLPPEFDVNLDIRQQPDFNDLHLLNRTGLSMLYNGALMTLFRPCLCRLDKKIHNQSARSKTFNQGSVVKCISSARKTIALLSWFTSSSSKLYSITPFWSTLHCLCEAISILLLEMALKCEHLPNEKQGILQDVKRGIRWLIMMSEQSISARKAWESFDRLLRIVAPLIDCSIADMPWQAPIPPGYNIFKYTPLPEETQHFQYPHPNITPFLNPVQLPEVTRAYSQSLPSTPFQLAANPLDDTAALERFLAIGELHGQFDDPWQHNFITPVETTEEMNILVQQESDLLSLSGDGAVRMSVGMGSVMPPDQRLQEHGEERGFRGQGFSSGGTRGYWRRRESS